MAILRLYFSETAESSTQETPELLSSYFQHPLLTKPCLTARGRSTPLTAGAGTFQWRPAVHALSILFLKARLAQLNAEDCESPILSGQSGSLASSLEYSLRKLPGWSIDMFGKTSSGAPLIRRILTCKNAGRRHAGLVSVGITRSTLQNLKVSVYLGNRELLEVAALQQLLGQLEQSWQPHSIKFMGSSSNLPVTQPKLLQQAIDLRNVIRTEILSVLKTTDVFRSATYKQHMQRMVDNISLQEVAGKNLKLAEPTEQLIYNKQQLGYFTDEAYLKSILCQDPPITICMAVIPSAISAIYLHLKLVKGYNIELRSDFLDASEIVEFIRDEKYKNPPDILTLGLPTAARLLTGRQSHDYQPFMPLPRHSVRAFSRKPLQGDFKRSTRQRKVLASCDRPTSATFYLGGLEAAGVLNRKSIRLEQASQQEIFAQLQDEHSDAIALTFFPHYQLNHLLNNCSFLDTAYQDLTFVDSLALAHRSFLQNRERVFCLNHAIRNAWLELRDGGAALEQHINFFLNNAEYLHKLQESAGLLTPVQTFMDLPQTA